MLVEVIFYETLSLKVWKAKFGPASRRTLAHPPTDTSMATVPLLAEVDEPADEDVVEVLPPPPVLAPPFPVADRPASTPVLATGDEGSLEASPVVLANGIARDRQGAKLVVERGAADRGAGRTGGSSRGAVDRGAADGAVDRGAVEASRSLHACLPPAAFTTVYDEVEDDLLYDDAEEDEELPELDPDVHAGPEHRWDIATMTVKEAMASWKGEAVKAAMEEEIRSLIGMGTWELVERPRGVNIMKNRWGITQVCGADYDETYSPVSSYVSLRIFLSIVAILDLNLMQLDMKNAFLQSKLDKVLYMYQADYFDDGTGRVCKLLKSLYGLKQSPLLWYKGLDGVRGPYDSKGPRRLGKTTTLRRAWSDTNTRSALMSRDYCSANEVRAGLELLYFKASNNAVASWVLVYVDDLLAASSSLVMLNELKELLEAAFELREILLVVKYLGLEIVRGRPARKLWLHQQGYADKLRRRFIDEEQGGRLPKTPVSVDAYAELTFDDEEAQEREEEEYRHKLGSGLTVRSDQHWREVDRCLAYLADTRDAALEFGSGPELLELFGYVDADDAGDKQNRTSTRGYVFVYRGVVVSCSRSRIKCATLSSTESEYVAATDAGKEGRQLCFVLAEFKLLNAKKPTILRIDNKSSITVAEGLGLTGNLKHMERRYACLQHMVRRGKFVLKYIPTTEQPADFLTKALHFSAFNRCSVAISQVRLTDVGDGDDDAQQ
ncbi:unnamed protein product [Closterium sp. NIES-54]